MKSIVGQSLLDRFSYAMHCLYLSDLKFMDDRERAGLAKEIRLDFSAESASLSEWNDALSYLTDSEPEKTAEAAREKLIQLLNSGKDCRRMIYGGRY